MRMARLAVGLMPLVLVSAFAARAADQPPIQANSTQPKPDPAEPATLGAAVGELRFKDIRHVAREFKELGEHRLYVLVAANTTCPLVQKYWPKLNELYDAYREQGVQFTALNVGPDDSISDMAQQGIDFAVRFPLVKDMDGSCTLALGLTRTPQVVVLDRERRVRYRGRIDDQHRIGGSRPTVSDESLRNAIETLLADNEASVPETAVDGCAITRREFQPPKDPVTFHEHLAPLLQKHCQECHHSGGTAPFPLVSYEETVAQAAMIAEVVDEQRMPPWHASRRHKFINERRLSASERRQFVAWAKTGTPAGDPDLAPPERKFSDHRWEIGEPDLKLTAFETHSLAPSGFIDYQYVVLPHVFLHDTWISAAEILPSNPAVVHHCNMAHWTVGKKFDAGAFITGRVPGGTAMHLDEGVALKIPANSVVGLQIHYTPTGKPEKNRMSVGFRFPRTEVRKELRHLQVTTSKFEIPPGAAAHEVVSSRVLPCDASGLGMFSHMHLRGRDMTFRAHTPDERIETLLSIPNYNFDWQQNYRWTTDSKHFPKGTRIEVMAHFDNSAFNPFNPDPTATVKFGIQTVHEMMFGFFFYTDDHEELGLRIDPRTGAVRPATDSANGALQVGGTP